MINHAPGAFGCRGDQHFSNNFLQCRRAALSGAGQGITAQSTKPHHPHFRLFTFVQRHPIIIDHDQIAATPDDWPAGGKVQRYNGDVLIADILPDIQLGPVGQREDTHGFTLVDAGVVGAPQLRALVPGVPAMLRIAEREDAFLGAGLLLIAAGASERGIEAILAEGLFEAFGLHDFGVAGQTRR